MTTSSPPDDSAAAPLWPLAIPLVIFLLFQFLLLRNVNIAQYDEAIYLDVARNIRELGEPLRSVGLDGRYYFEHLPGYVYTLSGATVVFGENERLLRLLTTAAGAGAVILAYLTGRRAQDSAAGFVAALLLSLNSFFAVYAYFIREEVPFTAFILFAAYSLLRLQQSRAWPYLLSAALSTAAAVLFKEIGFAFLAAAALYLLFVYDSWRARLAAATVLALPSIAITAGWLLWANHLDPAQLQVTIDRWTGAFGSGTAVVDPRLGLVSLDWLESMLTLLFGWELPLLLLFALGYAVIARRRPAPITLLFLFYAGLAVGASFLMSLKEMRHLMAVIPTFCLLVGLLLPWSDWWAWLAADRRRLLLAAPLATLFLISASPLRLTAADPDARWDYFYGERLLRNDAALAPVKEAGDYLAAAAPQDSLIAVVRQGPIVGYYAGLHYVFLYPRPLAENLALLAEADYVVVDSMEFWQQTPEETEALFDYLAQQFTPLRSFGDRITVYRRS
ncbi:MAG: ArnT family glycosyltransferase [Candidatus Promineifilaceae bacterium]